MAHEPVAYELDFALAEVPAIGVPLNGFDNDDVMRGEPAGIHAFAVDGRNLTVVQGDRIGVDEPVLGQVSDRPAFVDALWLFGWDGKAEMLLSPDHPSKTKRGKHAEDKKRKGRQSARP